jgi:peptidoglycan/LPS O-acetylase OafA/YrhL
VLFYNSPLLNSATLPPFPPKVKKSQQYKNEMFDLYRAIAVSMVVAGHFIGAAKDLPSYLLEFAAAATYLGVPLFFIISGYLLSGAFLSLLKRNDQHFFITTKLFLIKRVLRIYPAYLVSLSILFYFSQSSWLDFWVHFFNIHNLFEQYSLTLNAPFWTLAVEFQWYLVAPFFIYCFAKLSTIKQIAIILIFAAISYYLRYALLTDYLNKTVSLKTLTQSHLQLITHLFNFLIGITIQQSKIHKIKYDYLITPLILITLLWGGYWYDEIEGLLRYNPHLIQRYQLIYLYLTVFLLSFLVYIGASYKIKNGATVSFISSISYSWYIYHTPVLICFMALNLPWYQLISASLIVSIGLSTLSYYGIEKPFLTLSSLVQGKNTLNQVN